MCSSNRNQWSERATCSIAVLLAGISLFAGLPLNAHGQGKPEAAEGTVRVLYGPVENEEYAKLQEALQDAKVLEGIAADINGTFSLPADLSITFTECGVVNAFYDPVEQRVSMCYELIENFAEILAKHIKNEDQLDDAVVGATAFVFFHELGHALVHLLDLPITGKQEDAVDQLSTLILSDGSDEGEAAALQGALAFYSEDQDEDSKIDDLAFWGQHSLTQQRFYNIVCWVYGQNERKYTHLVERLAAGRESGPLLGRVCQDEEGLGNASGSVPKGGEIKLSGSGTRSPSAR